LVAIGAYINHKTMFTSWSLSGFMSSVFMAGCGLAVIYFHAR
jgi:hypothetical protein